MAQLQKMIADLTGSDQKAQQARERLELLKNAAEAHLQIAEDQISEMLHGNGSGLSSLYIVPASVTNFQSGYTVSTAEKIDDGITTAVDQFFSGDAKDGFKTVLKSTLSILFADTEAGEQKKNYYFVTYEHLAIIRVDVAIWKYYFTQKGLQDNVQQAFCYTFVKSVVDHTKVPLDVIVNLLATQMNDDLTKIKEFLAKMKELYGQLSGQKPADVAARTMAKWAAK